MNLYLIYIVFDLIVISYPIKLIRFLSESVKWSLKIRKTNLEKISNPKDNSNNLKCSKRQMYSPFSFSHPSKREKKTVQKVAEKSSKETI